MRLIDADALIPMMKYATTDSEIGVFPIKIGFNDIEKVINEQPTVNTAETDLISRQAAIDALRYAQHRFTVADEAGGMGTVKWSEDVIYFAAAERVLAELPSAQPEIIRCRECKFASGDSRICMKFDHSPIGELDFCAWAERRTDE